MTGLIGQVDRQFPILTRDFYICSVVYQCTDHPNIAILRSGM